MWVKETNYQPKRAVNECYMLVTRIRFQLSEDGEFILISNLPHPHQKKLLPLCHTLLHEWLSHSMLLHSGCHLLNVRSGCKEKKWKKDSFTRFKEKVTFLYLRLAKKKKKKSKYHQKCCENGEELWPFIIIIMHMKTKGLCLGGRSGLRGVSW